MNNDVLQQADEYTKKHKWKKRWKNIVTCLAAIVAFCTVFTLIMPASTLENDKSKISENSNIENCEATPSEPLDTVFPAAGQTFTLMSPGGEDADSWGVESYLDDTKPPKLYYSTDSGTTWLDTEGATDIPGNADFKLVVNYKDVPIDTLLENNAEISYTLPSFLRNAKSMGDIISGGNSVGEVTVEGATVTLQFDKNWLESHIMSNVIYGEFNVQAEADLSNIENNTPAEITVGDCIISIDFEDDVIAKYGDVEISKTVSTILEEDNGYYLTYTLTVTAGEYGCPEAKVVDEFESTQYIKEYVGVTVTDTATNVTDEETGVPKETSTLALFQAGTVRLDPAPTDTTPGTLVWSIGDMDANETRTLTYKVKLMDNYTGVAAKEPLINTANLYSISYQRDSDTATFTPTAQADIEKTCINFTPNENGVGGIITYSVVVTADSNNSYVLDNVKIVDALDRSVNSQNYTRDALRPYLNYIEDSFELYNGNGTAECPGSSGPIFTDTNGDGKNNDSFTYYVGSLAPGESRTLTYKLNVDPGIYIASYDLSIYVKNSAGVFADDSRQDGNTSFNNASASKSFDRKIWSRKIVGTPQEQETTVNMSGDAYDATGESVTQITTPENFTTPAGSYKYQVVVNEVANWDLTSTTMSDSFYDTHLQFVGYIQVDSYDTSNNPPNGTLTDQNVINNYLIKNGVLKQTVWVKVDGLSSFNFTPESIGINENYAYLLTYYAKPVNMDNITQVTVKNTFTLSGEVGIGNVSYEIIDGIEVSVSVLVEGSNSFSATKYFLDYVPPTEEETTGDWAKGALYWMIKIDGNVIPAGTILKDCPAYRSGTRSYLGEGFFVAAFIESSTPPGLVTLEQADYFTTNGILDQYDKSKYSQMEITLTQDITLSDGESLIIILKTAPSTLPYQKTGKVYYYNTLLSSSDGQNWVEHNTAKKILYGNDGIIKEMGRVFTYSASETGDITILTEGSGQNKDIDTTGLAPGTYVSWQIRVNYWGTLQGRYRMIEQIPEGMELAYLRCSWLGPSLTGDKRPVRVQLTADEQAALGEGWTEHSHTTGDVVDYYYTNEQQVIWDVDNLIYKPDTTNYSVEYQVVCRVTDPDVLLGGMEKEFNNTVSLQQPVDTLIAQDSCGVTVQRDTLFKESTYQPENGGRYPFKITLNGIGEDLVKDADTVTLVDTFSDTLILDADTISVTNTKT
ncbi:MAG: hypothetical protein ACI4II_08770, partial [Acutalibacteraceae bacterium]